MDGAMGTYFKSLHFDSNEAEVPEKAMLTSPVWIKDIHKEYMVSNDVVTDIIFDVMDNDFFNKGYHDQMMSILSYIKSKNMLIYQSL